MPKPTLQQRLSMRSSPPAAAQSSRAGAAGSVTLKRPDASFFYVGKAGALRFGGTVSGSIAAHDDFKRRLLEETHQ